MDNVLYTNTDNQEREGNELAELQAKAAMVVATSALGLGMAGYFIDKNEKARDILASLPGANRYSNKHDLSRVHSIANGVLPIDLTDIYKNQSSQKIGLSILSSIEELSPMGVLKTLQLSNFLEPFTKLTANKTPDVHITRTSIMANEDFYRGMLAKNNVVLEDRHIQNGFTIRNNQLFAIGQDGVSDFSNPLLKHVRLVSSHVEMGERVSPNRVLQKYANIQGAKLGADSFGIEQVMFIGSNNKASLVGDWMRAYVRQGLEIGYKTMDNPLSGFEDILKAGGLEHLPFAESNWYQKLKSVTNIQLGTGGRYDLSTTESMRLMAKNMTLKLGGLYVGYQGLNQTLNAVTSEDSIWHNGAAAGAASLYGDARVAAAKVIADPFQRYKQNQEAAAEDSTSLVTLAGFPIAGATLGASLSYYKRLQNSATLGVEAASSLSETEAGHGLADSLFKKMGIKNTAPYKSNAIKGALLGGAFALPFLPGALIGESSEDLKAEYSGEKRVENRANRWWLMGGNRYEGDHVKNFQSSVVHRLKSNPELHALYKGDMKAKLDDDAVFSPLKYLKNPYRREERFQEESPYPVWGMEVTTGSFMGRIFQATIGELIKPTRISPQMKAEMGQSGQDPRGEEVQRAVGEVVGNDVSVVSSKDAPGYKLATTKGLEQGHKSEAPAAIVNRDGSYSVATSPKRKDKELIEANMMLREDNAYVNETSQPLKKAYSAAGDFVGLKGFIGTTLLDKMGLDAQQSRKQLARSGSATSLDSAIRDQNVGDLMGVGEFQRRLVPTSASSKQETVNPLRNKAAPYWLPKDESDYYVDFGKGDYWASVPNGKMRLPGEGYAALNKEVKGINPNDYPLAHRYRILADVAAGSSEHIAAREEMFNKVTSGEITGRDKDLFYKTIEEEQKKSIKKRFNEYKTDEEKSHLSLGGKILNKIWEAGAHNAENPLESLSPFRPASKLIHQRSAIEDYNKTMLQGPDTGIWTSPYSHFIRPAWNKTKDAVLPGIQKPIEAQERDNVDEYFDKLAYIKARKNGATNEALKTTVARNNAGVYDNDSMLKFKAGLSSDQKKYVENFSKESDPDKREQILSMLPKHIANTYMGIWKNQEIAKKAKEQGIDPTVAVKKQHIEDTKAYEKEQNPNAKVEKSSNNLDIDFKKSIEKRLKIADKEAEEYVNNKTGVPSKDWVGWDPRLTMQDIKIRTLSLGKADIHKYGLWQPDKDRNERIVALDDEKEVTSKYNEIKRDLRNQNIQKEAMKRKLQEQGIVADKVEITPASRNDVRVVVKQDEK